MNYDQKSIDQALFDCCCEGYLHLLDGGKMRMVLTKYVLAWYHVKLFKRDCLYWHSVMNLPFLGKGKSFVPTACMDCWKVVARPRNFDEAMRTLEIMKDLRLMSKIGTEQRNTVPALWGAYFYNNTKREGLDCYQEVYAALRDPIFGDVPEDELDKVLLLKRGCTEYEQGVNGPSNTWQPFPGQENLEKYLKSRIEIMQANEGQSDFLKEMVLENWKPWAHSRGDLSYVPYNEGKRLTPEYVTYHHEIMAGVTA